MGSIDLVNLILLCMGIGTVLMVIVAAIRALVSRKRDIPYVPRHDMDGDAEALEDPDSVEQ